MSYFQDSTNISDENGKIYRRVKGNHVKISADFSLFYTYDYNNTRISNWQEKILGTIVGKIINYNSNVAEFTTFDNEITRVYDKNYKLINTFKGNILQYFQDSSKIITIAEDSIYLINLKSQKYFAFKNLPFTLKSFATGFLVESEHNTKLISWKGQILRTLAGQIWAYKSDFSKLILVNYDSTYIYDVLNNKINVFEGRLLNFNEKIVANYTNASQSKNDFTKFAISNNTNITILDWSGKNYSTFKGEIRGFTKDLSQIHVEKNNCTAFYNWNGQLTCTYPGKVFYFKADNQHVVMRVPHYEGYILKTYRLYNSFDEFMHNEVIELTDEERKLYGVDEYLKN